MWIPGMYQNSKYATTSAAGQSQCRHRGGGGGAVRMGLGLGWVGFGCLLTSCCYPAAITLSLMTCTLRNHGLTTLRQMADGPARQRNVGSPLIIAAPSLVTCSVVPGIIFRARAGFSHSHHRGITGGAANVDMKLEVAVLPVADVDRTKAFYQGLGWRLDADISVDQHHRVVQLTPPDSPA